jgi:hypothetical protein
MKKRKHHYVWEHYLRAWGKQIWCRRSNGHCFPTSTENVAQSRDFYRLREVSDLTISFIEALIDRFPEPLVRDAARGWIPHFRLFFQLQSASVAWGMDNPEVAEELDRAINDLEEEIHTGIEGAAVPLLAALKNADVSFLDDNARAIEFTMFIAFQHLRTQHMEKTVLRSLGCEEVPPGVDLESAWGLLRTVTATSMSFAFFSGLRGTQLSFLDSGPSTQFITADQPTVNTLATPGATAAPTELELYYPLSPGRALLWTFDRPPFAVHRRQLTDDETVAFNRLIAGRSGEQIYAAAEHALRQTIEGYDR